MLVLALGLAAAQSPEIHVTPEGAVQGYVVVPASVDTVREALVDSSSRAAVVDNGAQVQATVDGACELEQVHVPHPLKAVDYLVRSCPTEHGVRSSLVESDDLARFEATWDLQPVDGGTRVGFALDMAMTFPVPSFVMRAQAKQGVADALNAVRAAFAR